MIRYDVEKYRRLQSRADQLNAAARASALRCREATEELQSRNQRWSKERELVNRTMDANDDDRATVSALERDVEVARVCYEQRDRERVESQEKWNAAATLFRACQDFLLANGVSDPDAPHDQHGASGLIPGRMEVQQ